MNARHDQKAAARRENPALVEKLALATRRLRSPAWWVGRLPLLLIPILLRCAVQRPAGGQPCKLGFSATTDQVAVMTRRRP